MPAFYCGLIDDVLQSLLSRSCPSYFLPQINLLDRTDDATILNLGKFHKSPFSRNLANKLRYSCAIVALLYLLNELISK